MTWMDLGLASSAIEIPMSANVSAEMNIFINILTIGPPKNEEIRRLLPEAA